MALASADNAPDNSATDKGINHIPAGKPDGYTASKTVSKTIKMVAPSIAAGESVTFKYQALILPEAAGTTLRNSVVFTGKDGNNSSSTIISSYFLSFY